MPTQDRQQTRRTVRRGVARRAVRHPRAVPPIAKVEPITTARALRGPFDYLRPDGVGIGSVLVVPFGHRDVVGVVVGLADSSVLPDERLVAPRRVLDHDLPPDLVELAVWMADEYCSTPARALALVSPPPGGRAKLTWWASATGAGPMGPSARRAQPPLTSDQARVLADVEAALQQHQPLPLLLHGVTGSGKTEIYLRAAATALAQGKGVIILVPEIALTPQIVSRFVDRFGDTVAVLHSKLSAGERHDEWARLRAGAARVCVGPPA